MSMCSCHKALAAALERHSRAETVAWESLEGCAAELAKHAANHDPGEALRALHRGFNHLHEALGRREAVYALRAAIGEEVTDGQ